MKRILAAFQLLSKVKICKSECQTPVVSHFNKATIERYSSISILQDLLLPSDLLGSVEWCCLPVTETLANSRFYTRADGFRSG